MSPPPSAPRPSPISGKAGRSVAERLGVCSWSLKPRSPADLADKARATGVGCLQLALDPLRTGQWGLDRVERALGRAGIAIRSGMMGTAGEDYSSIESIRATGGVRPDATWPENLARARAVARLAWRLRLPLVSFHAGFLPHDPADPERDRLVARLREIVDVFADHGIATAFETGQEDAETLLAVLDGIDRPTVGVNFDPANMLLYGTGDPVPALRALLPRVLQVHVKDARRSPLPGRWGEERPVGEGEVDWAGFFGALAGAGWAGDLMIEREAGDDRVGDAARARELVATWLEDPAWH